MKKYALLLMLTLLACNEKGSMGRTYDNLSGAWFFADAQVSGEIWISDLAGFESIDRKGYFSFETFSFVVSDNSQIRYKVNGSGAIDFVYLVSTNTFGNAELYLLDGVINADFTEIAFASFMLIRANSVQDVFDREIVMKRR